MSRVRQKAGFWMKHFACQADSDLTAVKYCALKDLRISTFYKGQRRLAQQSKKHLPVPSKQNSESQGQKSLPERPEEISFAQVEVSLPPSAHCFDGIAIGSPCGMSVRLSSMVDEPSLRSLLRVLREFSSC